MCTLKNNNNTNNNQRLFNTILQFVVDWMEMKTMKYKCGCGVHNWACGQNF